MGSILRLIMAIVLCWVTVSGVSRAGETIHSWTDSKGVRHFSTTLPPEGALNQKTFIQEDNDSDSSPQGNEKRMSYDVMVDAARIETNRLDRERSQAKALRQKQEKDAAEKRREDAFQAKRRELQKQIDALMGRALSRTYSKGMRDSQIKAIKDKMAQLEKEAGFAQNSQ